MTSDGIGPKGPGGGLEVDRGSGGEIGDEAASVIELTGVIKWFDVSKGYGFIVPDNGMPDILLHVTCLRRDGFQVAYEGRARGGRGAAAAARPAGLPHSSPWTNRRRCIRRRCRRRAPT